MRKCIIFCYNQILEESIYEHEKLDKYFLSENKSEYLYIEYLHEYSRYNIIYIYISCESDSINHGIIYKHIDEISKEIENYKDKKILKLDLLG